MDEAERFCPQCGAPMGKPSLLNERGPFRILLAFCLGFCAVVLGGAGSCFAIFAPEMGGGGMLGWFAIAAVLFGLGWLCVYGIRRLFRK